MEEKCPKCGETIPEGAEACPACGEPAPEKRRPNPFGVDLPESDPEPEPGRPAANVCPNCGTEVPSGSRVCAQCGVMIPPGGIAGAVPPAPNGDKCSNCGAELPPGISHCSLCGRRIPGRTKPSSVTEKVLLTLFFVVIGIPAGLFGACSLVFAGGNLGADGGVFVVMAVGGLGLGGLLTWLWIRALSR